MSPTSEAGPSDASVSDGVRRVVVATGNPHKVAEIRDALAATGWEFVSASDMGGWLEPEETGDTFHENARIKAVTALERYGVPSLADDSGLEVDALGGEPGVHSSRYAGERATDAENNVRLLSALAGIPAEERSARFRSVIVFVGMDTEVMAEGTCEGHIGTALRGENGFGYDPLFWPEATPGCTMAELTMAEKNAISHRGAALRALGEKLGSGRR